MYIYSYILFLASGLLYMIMVIKLFKKIFTSKTEMSGEKRLNTFNLTLNERKIIDAGTILFLIGSMIFILSIVLK